MILLTAVVDFVRRTSALAAILLAGAPPALAQQLGGAKPLEIPFLQILAALVVCSLAAFAAAVVLQRRAGRTVDLKFRLPWLTKGPLAKRALRVLDSQRLSPHADVCRFTAYDREYVVIVTAGAITIVSDQASPAKDPPTSDLGTAP